MNKYKILLILIQLMLIAAAIVFFVVPFEFEAKGYYDKEPYHIEENYTVLEPLMYSKKIYDNVTTYDCRPAKVNSAFRFTYEWKKDWTGIATCYITNNDNEIIRVKYFFKHKPTVGGWVGDGSGDAEIKPNETFIATKSYKNIAEENIANCEVDESSTQICPIIVKILDTFKVVEITDYINVTKIRNVTKHREVYIPQTVTKKATLFQRFFLDNK